MKTIRFTQHAREQIVERGTTEEEVSLTILNGKRERAKKDRLICRANFQYNSFWNGRKYAIKQVAAVIVEKEDETTVVTVYTFFF